MPMGRVNKHAMATLKQNLTSFGGSYCIGLGAIAEYPAALSVRKQTKRQRVVENAHHGQRDWAYVKCRFFLKNEAIL